MPVNHGSSHVPSSFCVSSRYSTPRSTDSDPTSPAANKPIRAQAVCEAVDGARAPERRLVVTARSFAPASVLLLLRLQPVGREPDADVGERHADRCQTDQRLPRAVEIIHAPAAVPAMVGLLPLPDELDRLLNGRMIAADLQIAGQLEHAGRQIDRARIDHRVVVGEGDAGEKLAAVVGVERAPSRRRAPASPKSTACRAKWR